MADMSDQSTSNKLLYYVPVVLVVRAAGYEDAVQTADDIITAVTNLKPEDLEGYCFPADTEATPASTEWFDCETNIIRSDENKLLVVEFKEQ